MRRKAPGHPREKTAIIRLSAQAHANAAAATYLQRDGLRPPGAAGPDTAPGSRAFTSSPPACMARARLRPIPRTRSARSVNDSNAPPRSRSRTISSAVFGPMPRTEINSATVAALASTASAEKLAQAPETANAVQARRRRQGLAWTASGGSCWGCHASAGARNGFISPPSRLP